MARIGLYSTLIILVFGVVAPFFIFKLCRWIGFRAFLALTVCIGLGYGAAKAEYPWYGDGIVRNTTSLMAASALVLVAYVALSYGGASLVGRAALLFRR